VTAQDVPGPDWNRVHPLTPLIRSWQVLAVVLFFLVQDLGQGMMQGGSMPWEQLPEEGLGALPGRFLAGGSALVVIVLALLGTWVYFSWRMTRYRVSEEALELHTGVLFRQQRRARLDRLQAVDVSQPLLARITGLARLTLEVAGAGDSKIELAYLTEAQAQSLRGHLLARAAGLRYDSAEAPQAPEHPVLEVTPGRLVGSLVLSGVFVAVVVTVVSMLVMTVMVGSFAIAAGTIPVLLGTGSVLFGRFSSGFGFRLAASADGLRARRGLLEQRAQTVPPGRVQAVRVEQPLLWRRTDWWRVEVNVAGYGANAAADSAGESVLLPVGTKDQALTVVALLVPDLGQDDGEDPLALMGRAMYGQGAGGGFVTAPRAARWLDPLAWWRIGFRVTGTVLLTRGGWLARVCDIVPHARTQSLAVTQGPLQRRLGLASFALHSTPGPVSAGVPHLALGDAARLLDEQSVRARHARSVAGPERWMEELASRDGLREGLGHALDEPQEAPEPAGVEELADPSARVERSEA
jgi:putative membrane protein